MEQLLVIEPTHNDVLRELAQSDQGFFAQLMRDLEPHPLQRGVLLGTPRLASNFLYFIDSGVVSLVANTKSGNSVEVALVGREGVAGCACPWNQPLPYSLVVQLPGLAYRAPKELIREHILSCSALHELLMNYSQRVMHQLAQSALCNRFHTSVQRLARWLLLTAERADTNRFELTHEFHGTDGRRPPLRCQRVRLDTARQRDHRLSAWCAHDPKREAAPTRSRANVSMSCPRRNGARSGWSIRSKDQ